MVLWVVFDVGNTLFDSKRVKKRIYAKNIFYSALVSSGFVVKRSEALVAYAFVTDFLRDSWFVGKYPPYIKDSLAMDFLELDYTKSELLTVYNKRRSLFLLNEKIFPDVVRLLCMLRKNGFKLGIVANSKRVELMDRLNFFKIKKFFDVIVCSQDCGSLKLDLVPYFLFLKKAGIKDSSKCLYVGDDYSQDSFSKKVGMHFLHLKDPKKIYSLVKEKALCR